MKVRNAVDWTTTLCFGNLKKITMNYQVYLEDFSRDRKESLADYKKYSVTNLEDYPIRKEFQESPPTRLVRKKTTSILNYFCKYIYWVRFKYSKLLTLVILLAQMKTWFYQFVVIIYLSIISSILILVIFSIIRKKFLLS